MIKKLLIVFASGLVLSVLLLSTAWVIGGDALLQRAHGWRIGGDGEYSGPVVTRTLAFDGARPLAVDAPVNLRFVKGDKSEMRVQGPETMMNRLVWENGRLSLKDGAGWAKASLDITITAPRIAGLILDGASDVELTGLDQPSLTIEAHGATDLDAAGRVRTLTLASSGAGDLDLTKVEAGDATVEVSGVGDVDISASGNVSATISGAGDITLHRKPAMLTSKVSGFGSISHAY